MDLDEILPELFVGAAPDGPDNIRLWKQQGITAVLTLQTDEDLQRHGLNWPQRQACYVAEGLTVRRVAVRDFDDNDLRSKLPECTRVLDELLAERHVVYVHCSAGVNRSPCVVICYLHWYLGWCLKEAERHVRKYHRCSPATEVIGLATRDRRQALE
jgi:protein-tyrosine phosphatase